MSRTPAAPPEIIEPPPRHRFDVEALGAYLEAHVPGFAAPLHARQFTGGQSNPTFLLEAGSGRYIMRKKPAGELLPSAHAVDREYRVITALADSDVPVPRTYCLCEDESVIGQSFYIMEYVDGRVIRDPSVPGVSAEERAAMYRSLAQVLARLHAVDYKALGLEDYGRPGNYFQRQLARWSKQYEVTKTREIASMDALMAWLPPRIPADESSSIAHGDYRLENTIVHPREPRVVAVLDWELSTIGHPLADLGLNLVAFYAPAGMPTGFAREEDKRAPGLPTPEAYVAEYCRAAGRAGIPDLQYYVIFSMFRLASILQGIAMRAITGTASSAQAAHYGDYAGWIADAAWKMARHQS
ncbi:MAG: phosphotransferase [Candidatus Lambdaproteobacteria bacterium]|nr:phosphotransferase [Candidatus Lambdaproteobacteria bacterium]